MLFIFLLACVSEVQLHPKLQDRDNYDRAMQLSGSAALSFCSQIASENLRGECVLFAAKQEAHRRQDSRALCGQAPTEAWQEACRFDVVDILGMTGSRADQACRQTGDFQSRCMYHALLREEEQLAARFPAGSELELIQAIQERMGQLFVDEAEEEPLQVVLTARILARRFEAKWRKNTNLNFSREDCGQAPDDVCAEAYRIANKQIGKGRRPSNCSLPMTKDRVEQVGLPVWSDSFTDLAQRAWKSLCHINRGPSRAPDHSSSQRGKQ